MRLRDLAVEIEDKKLHVTWAWSLNVDEAAVVVTLAENDRGAEYYLSALIGDTQPENARMTRVLHTANSKGAFLLADTYFSRQVFVYVFLYDNTERRWFFPDEGARLGFVCGRHTVQYRAKRGQIWLDKQAYSLIKLSFVSSLPLEPGQLQYFVNSFGPFPVPFRIKGETVTECPEILAPQECEIRLRVEGAQNIKIVCEE